MGYGGWFSIEMRQPEFDWLAVLDQSVANAVRFYFPAVQATALRSA